MLITLSRRTAICQSVAEVQLTGVAPFGAVSHRFNFNKTYLHVSLGLTDENDVWRIRTNNELDELFKDPFI